MGKQGKEQGKGNEDGDGKSETGSGSGGGGGGRGGGSLELGQLQGGGRCGEWVPELGWRNMRRLGKH